ncbi:mechanosensitive ion channel family protein [Sedimentimonas flavescens]|uniref:mechanosensitive ion channel family protein n=1 Tax=Sedimentimonas flavescens TaxID=2851012 RepID=UPI0021A4B097|nr:mechanosensitive ion channel domain-containing protein [Sedimentimonas flavescens]MCT2539638.1 mechanosensitive ion channel [Sedimentimonas flavescens]
MDFINPETLKTIQSIWHQVEIFFHSLILPSRLWQLAIILVCFGIAHLGRIWLAPKVDDWARNRELSPRQLRSAIIFRKRLRGVIFILLAWSAVFVLSELSPFYSRRFIVVLAATLVTAWLVVGMLARLIHNDLLRRIVTWGVWIYVALYYLGFADEAAGLLDSAAITIGDFRLSALAVLKAMVLTALLVSGARAVTRRATARIRANTDISPSMSELVIKVMQVLFYGAALFVGLKSVGFDLTGLAVLSGAIGVGLGFGLQKVVSNLVSGVIILLDKSIKPGDVISIGDTFGWINSLGARYVSVVTRDGKEYLIPNEDLITGQVVNWSHSDEFVRIDLTFGTSYHDDPHKVRELAVSAAQSVSRVLRSRPAVCHITGFGESSVDYVLRFWIKDPVEGLTNVRGAVYLALWDAFHANGISIPFPQREVRVLGGPTSDATASGENPQAGS